MLMFIQGAANLKVSLARCYLFTNVQLDLIFLMLHKTAKSDTFLILLTRFVCQMAIQKAPSQMGLSLWDGMGMVGFCNL